MPKFLTREEIYRIIQRELPDAAYPDGSPSGYYSTADSDATAQTIKSAYDNQQIIYNNQFPQDCDERINDWEITAFGAIQDSTLTLAERITRVLAKLRELPNMTVWNLQNVLLGILSSGIAVQVYELCHDFGNAWKLDYSLLDYNTFFDIPDYIVLPLPSDYCNPEAFFDTWILDVSELDNTTEFGGENNFLDDGTSGLDWGYQQVFAFSYFVRVFDYVLSASERELIESTLTRIERGVTQHFLSDNHTFSEFDLNIVVTDVVQSDNIDTVYKDPLSSTGISGRVVDGV